MHKYIVITANILCPNSQNACENFHHFTVYTSVMDSPKKKIRSFAQLQSYKKGSTIFFQGEIPRKGAMISDGIIRSFTIATSGEERTIAFFTKYDILPLSWLMGTTSTSLFYYEAVSDVRMFQFSRNDFQTHLLGDKDSLLSMFETLSKDHTAAMLRINGLEQSRAEEKVAFTLYYLLFRYGQPDKDGIHHTINITLRHAMIAGLVGLSRESTTKILGTLQKQSIIDYKNGTYKVNKSLLENHIGEDSFRDVILQ